MGRHLLRQLPAHTGRVCVCVCDSAPVTAVCVRRRVPRLVYTSSVNVAFGGKPIEQGDEDSVPYFPLEKVPGFQERWAGSVGRKGRGQPQFTAQGVSQEEGVPSPGWHRPALILASHASRDCEIRWTCLEPARPLSPFVTLSKSLYSEPLFLLLGTVTPSCGVVEIRK